MGSETDHKSLFAHKHAENNQSGLNFEGFFVCFVVFLFFIKGKA